MIYDIDGNPLSAYHAEDEMEHGSMSTETGSVGFTHGNNYFWKVIRNAHIVEVGSAPVIIAFNASDLQYISTVGVYYYGLSGYIGHEALTVDSNGRGVYTPASGVKYIKILAVLNTTEKRGYHDVSFYSSVPLNVVKNLDVRNTTHSNVAFTYAVGSDNYTIGQLLLPPNYTVDGDSVPLYVRVHGTGAMSKWTDTMGINGHYDSRYLSQYMANEGFAVFDCYPWTDLYYSESEKISPFNIEIHRSAYIDGIKYVCDRYNVDINRVCMSFKSLGGQLGHWFMSQTDLPVAALAMLTPSTGYASTIWGIYFLQKNAREAIVDYLGLENETNASLFINTTVGMENADVVKFVEDHLREFASLIPASIATHGATYLQHYDRMVTGVDTLPQWMADLGIPKWPSAWEDDPHATGVPDVINHPDLTRYSLYPVKFWHAFDDVNTSGHVDYTIYTWLLNGGSDVEWRTVPWGTGGHNATDLAEDAVKVSGTTRLGIAYSNIAESYVEMADFFFKKMCME